MESISYIDRNCTTYMYTPAELIVPSPIIFTTFCTSYGKTQLFIMSFLRLFVWIIIYNVMHETIDMKKHTVLKLLIIVLLIINIIYIGIVVAKHPNVSIGKKQLEGDVAILIPID